MSESEQKYFRGMPVRNATRPLYMRLEKIDVEKGVPQDPENCAFAECLKRNLKVDYARVDRSRAYVESVENGRSVLDYYVVRGATRDYVETFDKGDIKDKKGNLQVPLLGFKLRPPSPSESLGYKAPSKPIQYASPEQAIKQKGEVRVGAVPPPKPISVKVSPLRNSTGKIKFDRV